MKKRIVLLLGVLLLAGCEKNVTLTGQMVLNKLEEKDFATAKKIADCAKTLPDSLEKISRWGEYIILSTKQKDIIVHATESGIFTRMGYETKSGRKDVFYVKYHRTDGGLLVLRSYRHFWQQEYRHGWAIFEKDGSIFNIKGHYEFQDIIIARTDIRVARIDKNSIYAWKEGIILENGKETVRNITVAYPLIFCYYDKYQSIFDKDFQPITVGNHDRFQNLHWLESFGGYIVDVEEEYPALKSKKTWHGFIDYKEGKVLSYKNMQLFSSVEVVGSYEEPCLVVKDATKHNPYVLFDKNLNQVSLNGYSNFSSVDDFVSRFECFVETNVTKTENNQPEENQ
jgi:hypothetical protein